MELKNLDLFAPRIYIKNPEGELEPFKLLVFQANKTLIPLLFKNDYNFTYEFLDSLTKFLTLHGPPVSSQLDNIISKVLSKEDPIRFIYFN